MARSQKRLADIGFTAITIEGGLISPDQVVKVASTTPDQKTAAEYSCPKGVSLRDEITRYFQIGKAIWKSFASIETPTQQQTDAFVEELLTSAFGFELTRAGSRPRGDRRFAIAFEGSDGRVPVVVTAPLSLEEDGKSKDAFTVGRTQFGDGANGRIAKRSAALLLQDWLNANADFYWGLVFAGDRVRLMRDNASFTRPAFIEADLGAIFRDDMFAEFTAWWLLTHASRFGKAGAPPSEAPLEHWREAGMEAGTAVRDKLRGNVESALLAIGKGLLGHNPELRRKIDDNELSMQSLFEQMLRMVYRLIFLAVAEDRDLLHAPGTARATKQLYQENYGFAYLRNRATRRGSRDTHGDAWEGLKIVFSALARGEKDLGLPALGGLFSADATPDLEQCAIPNRYLLEAIFNLGWMMEEGRRVRINWRDMATEEFGSVYEGLLELTPTRTDEGRSFDFVEDLKGNARKTSGSYYTPDRLVQTLLDSALNPVLEKAEAVAREEGILDLKIIDPACGSGHFLLGAARRMATRVAQLRDPDAPDYNRALREVVGRCVHGVDRNPMAVELAKVALWIESVSPGQPLGFLDANIRCGDALLGVFDLEALEQGIPDDAYKPLTGDVKEAAAYYKKKNKDEKKGQGSFDFASGTGAMPPKKLAANLSTIRRMPEDTVGQVEKKREAFETWKNDPDRRATRVACDFYTAAFLMTKVEVPENYQRGTVPTTADVWKRLGGGQVFGLLEAAAVDASEEARAFHWPLAFPDVLIGKGGFDVVLGNPPWERIKLQEQEFFAGHEVADASNAAARTRAIAKLAQAEEGSSSRLLYDAFQTAKRIAEATSAFARVSGEDGGRYPYTGTGDVNTYALFSEHFLNLLEQSGRAGIIVPTGIATDATTAPFFGHLVSEKRLARLFDFENSAPIFPGVHRSFKFSLLTLGNDVDEAEFSFFLTDPSQLEDSRRRFTLSPAEIARINPNTKTAPVFRARKDAELTATIYNRVSVLIDEAKGGKPGEPGNPWGISFMAMFHMSNDSHLFRTSEQLAADGWERQGTDWVRPSGARGNTPGLALTGGRDTAHLDLSTGSPAPASEKRYVPLYEAKMFDQFNHRYADYSARGGERGHRVLPELDDSRLADPSAEAEPFYWVRQTEVASRTDASWLMGYGEATTASTSRTMVMTAFPATGVGHKEIEVFLEAKPSKKAAFLANANSTVLDVVCRTKVSYLNLGQYIVKQLPILPPSAYSESDLGFIVPRVLELSYTSHSMAPFARDLGYEGEPFRWNEDRRAQLRAELDAWYALAYGLSRNELRYVLDPKDVMGEDYPSETFRVLKNNEIRKHGEYRTQRLVLAAYDKLIAEGMRPRVEGYR
ncbi:Eco57I restriction-modification methylase domain-containing protein [Aurantiacibacter zhengii]|uniref:site-specific DNA-methyltransferase (adenine-specific) n=1 Tax=Aurantiacibacter zhengii TaxID=2307003 RepID=A0A418NNE0_9SPHN|nr:N-6 DNA methylase [Aurantiacibacter zhengii]RIV83148.1 type II DNA modification enzyme [Aurantiacibacter zhengii]